MLGIESSSSDILHASPTTFDVEGSHLSRSGQSRRGYESGEGAGEGYGGGDVRG